MEQIKRDVYRANILDRLFTKVYRTEEDDCGFTIILYHSGRGGQSNVGGVPGQNRANTRWNIVVIGGIYANQLIILYVFGYAIALILVSSNHHIVPIKNVLSSPIESYSVLAHNEKTIEVLTDIEPIGMIPQRNWFDAFTEVVSRHWTNLIYHISLDNFDAEPFLWWCKMKN